MATIPSNPTTNVANALYVRKLAGIKMNYFMIDEGGHFENRVNYMTPLHIPSTFHHQFHCLFHHWLTQ